MRRFFDPLNVLLILGMVGFALWAWPQLPERIPTHFGPDGLADGWNQKTLLTWFMLPGIAILLTLGLGWVRAMFWKRPHWTKLPDKRRLTELPEAARRPVQETLSGFMALVQTELLVIFALIEWGSYRAAMGGSSQGIMITVLVLAVLGSPTLLVVFFLGLQRALDKGKKLAAREAAMRAT